MTRASRAECRRRVGRVAASEARPWPARLRALCVWAVAWSLAASASPASQALPLRAGTSGDYPPFSMVASDGRRSGFDVDVTRHLAQFLGRPLELAPFRWPELSERAAAGAFDLIASGVTIRPERTLLGRFTRPYALSEAVVLVRREDASRYRSIADLEEAQARVVVNRGGHLERVARATFGRARVEAVDDNRTLDGLVAGGRAAAVVTDSIEALQLRPMIRVATLTRDRKAIFVPGRLAGAGDAQRLHAAVDRWLAEHNGEVDALRLRWLGAASTLDADAARAEAVIALIDQRLGLAPSVAAVKRAAGLPIEDSERERAVLAAAAEHARASALSEDAVARLFAVLIGASKDLQRAAAEVETSTDLATLRRVLSELDARLIAELAAARRTGEVAERLRAGIDSLSWPGLTADRRRALSGAAAAALRPP